jgi:hypothetical protein
MVIRRWAELGAVATGGWFCIMHVRRLFVAGKYSDGASTGQDGRAKGQMGFYSMGRAEDICTACTPALLTTHPTPTDTHTHTLVPSSHR